MKIIRYGSEVVYVEVREGEVARSEFPHELVTIDLDDEHRLLGVEIVNSSAVNSPRERP